MVLGIALRQGKKLVGEAVSLAGAGDPIRFLQKRTGTALNLKTNNFMIHQILEVSHTHLTFGLETQKKAEAVKDIITIFKYNSSPGKKGDFQIRNI